MRYKIIDKDTGRCIDWMAKNNFYCYGQIAIGLELDGDIIAVALYSGFTGKVIDLHLGLANNARVTRSFVWFIHYYAFMQAGANILMGKINADNIKALNIAKHAGCVEIARLPDATDEGLDIVILALYKQNSPWLTKAIRL